MQIRVTKLPIEGLLLILPAVHGDRRGEFSETYNERELREAGVSVRFVQENQSRSAKGVLRGLHFQTGRPQGKLVRAVRGEVFDVAVDLRRGSPTFARWHGVRLSERNRLQFLIPEGFAHGFLALTEGAELLYQCTDYYDPSCERGIAWNDPHLAISWGVSGEYRGSASAAGYSLGDIPLLLSQKDEALPTLGELGWL